MGAVESKTGTVFDEAGVLKIADVEDVSFGRGIGVGLDGNFRCAMALPLDKWMLLRLPPPDDRYGKISIRLQTQESGECSFLVHKLER